jgi:hypothetical protein
MEGANIAHMPRYVIPRCGPRSHRRDWYERYRISVTEVADSAAQALLNGPSVVSAEVAEEAMVAYFEQQLQQTVAREAALRQDGEVAVEMALEEGSAIAEELEAAKAVMTSQRHRYDTIKAELEATKAKLVASEAARATLRAYVMVWAGARERAKGSAAKARREGRLWPAAGIEKSLE